MLEDALFGIEKSIQDALGTVPIVFKSLTRNYQFGTSSNELPSVHEFHELSYVTSGSVNFVFSGEVVTLNKGSSIIISPGTVHSYSAPDESSNVTVLYFTFENWDADQSKKHVSTVSMSDFITFATGYEGVKPPKHPYIIISGRNRETIRSTVERILAEGASDGYGHRLMMQFMTMELMILLCRVLKDAWEESILVKQGKAKELVHIAKDYMLNHYDQPISVSDVAGYVFLSQGYFARAFRDEVGQSPMAFLIEVRINKACELLRDNRIKISSVAKQTGFASPQRFNVAFRKQVGMTPMEYRKKLSEESGHRSSKK